VHNGTCGPTISTLFPNLPYLKYPPHGWNLMGKMKIMRHFPYQIWFRKLMAHQEKWLI
jgi:hypothetical protein